MILSEYQEQCLVVEYCELKHIPIYAIPNSNDMSSTNRMLAIKIMRKLKRSGLRPGFPDLCIPVMSNNYGGMYIELKKAKNGVVTDNQKKWIALLNKRGYLAMVCNGAMEAIKEINNYVSYLKKGGYR